jgi:hypothetical protein
MLLKFYAENFSSESTGNEGRTKSGSAHIVASFKLKISHWLSRYFTRAVLDDRIHSALVDFSTNKILIFRAAVLSRSVEGK